MLLLNLKNGFKSLKFYFTPVGVLAIFTAAAFAVLIGGAANSLGSLFNELGAIVGDSKIDWGSVWNSIADSFAALNGQFANVLSEKWIFDVLVKAITASGLGESVNSCLASIQATVANIVGLFIQFIVLIALGLVVGHIVLMIQIRADLVKDKWYKNIIFSFVDAILQVGLQFGLIMIITLWNPFIFIFIVLSPALTEMLSILEAYFIHAFKTLKFRDVFTVKAILLLILGDIIILIIAVALTVLLFFLLNPFVALLLGLPLIQIATIVMRLNAESYVIDKMNKAK